MLLSGNGLCHQSWFWSLPHFRSDVLQTMKNLLASLAHLVGLQSKGLSASSEMSAINSWKILQSTVGKSYNQQLENPTINSCEILQSTVVKSYNSFTHLNLCFLWTVVEFYNQLLEFSTINCWNFLQSTVGIFYNQLLEFSTINH